MSKETRRDLVIAFLMFIILTQGYFLFFRADPYAKIYTTFNGKEAVDSDELRRVVKNIPQKVQDKIIIDFVYAHPKKLRMVLRTMGEAHWRMDAAEIVLRGREQLNPKDERMKRILQGKEANK